MARLSDVSPGDIITSARQNTINDYINDGTEYVNTQYLQIGGTTLINTTGDISNLQTSTTGSALCLARNLAAASTDGPIALFYNCNASDDKPPLHLINAGTGNAIFVDQNGTVAAGSNSTAIEVDVAAAGNSGLFVSREHACSTGVDIYNASSRTVIGMRDDSSCGSNWFCRNVAAATTAGPVVSICNASATDDQVAVQIINAANAFSLNIGHSYNAVAVNIDSEATSSPALTGDVNASSSTFAFGNPSAASATYYFARNVSAACSAAPVMFVLQDNATDDQPVIQARQDGTGSVINIPDKYAGSSNFISAYEVGSGVVMNLGARSSSGATFDFTRNLAAVDTAGPVMRVCQDNTGDDQASLYVCNDGTSYAIYASRSQNTANSVAGFYDESGGAGCNYVEFGIGGDSDRRLINARRNLPAANTGQPMVSLIQDNATDDQSAVYIQSDGTGSGITLCQNASAANGAIYMVNSNTGWGANLVQNLALSGSSGLLRVYSNTIDTMSANGLATFVGDNASNTSKVLFVQQDGAANALYVCKTHATAPAVEICAEPTDTPSVWIHGRANAGKPLLAVNNNTPYTAGESKAYFVEGSTDGGATAYLWRSLSTATDPVLEVIQDDATNAAIATKIQQDGAAIGLSLDHNANAVGLYVDSEATSNSALCTTGFAVDFIQDIANGYGLKVSRNIAEVGTYPLVCFFEDNATSTKNVLSITNDGTGVGLDVRQNGAGIGVNVCMAADGTAFTVDSTSATYNSIWAFGKRVAEFNPTVSGGYGLLVDRNLAEAGSYPLVCFLEDHASGTQNVLAIKNDGTGKSIYVNSTAAAIAVDVAVNAAACTAIQVNGKIMPAGDSLYDIGADGTRFCNIYADNVYSGDIGLLNNWRITEMCMGQRIDGVIIKNGLGCEMFKVTEDGLFFKGNKVA